MGVLAYMAIFNLHSKSWVSNIRPIVQMETLKTISLAHVIIWLSQHDACVLFVLDINKICTLSLLSFAAYGFLYENIVLTSGLHLQHVTMSLLAQ